MKLIDLYKEWMGKGKIPKSGLCNSLPHGYDDAFDLLRATIDDRDELVKAGYDFTYWASGLKTDHKNEERCFTPLRQTIVLLICAMHDEL